MAEVVEYKCVCGLGCGVQVCVWPRLWSISVNGRGCGVQVCVAGIVEYKCD